MCSFQADLPKSRLLQYVKDIRLRTVHLIFVLVFIWQFPAMSVFVLLHPILADDFNFTCHEEDAECDFCHKKGIDIVPVRYAKKLLVRVVGLLLFS